MAHLRGLRLGLAALLVVLGLGLAPGAAGARALRLQIGGPPPKVPAGARALGTLAASTRLRLTVALRPRDPQALASYVGAVSTPGSPDFRHYLSVAQFAQRFGATTAEILAVSRALRAQGLIPLASTPNRLGIPVRATAGQAAQAFGTGLERFRLRDGRVAYANRAPPQLGAGAAGYVQAVVGLNTLAVPAPLSLRALRRARARAPHVLTGGPQPCPQAGAASARTADQIAAAYRFSTLYAKGDLGVGQTIALYELEPYSAADIGAYQACYGTSTPVENVPVDGGAGAGSGEGEAALDIEVLAGLAPGAKILVYSGPNASSGAAGSGPYDTYAAIIAQNRAKVISTSWGVCERLEGSADAGAESTLFQEAAVQGQSILAASGDNGSTDCTNALGAPTAPAAVDDPASQPGVTGVGGTTLSALGPPPAESVWNSRLGAGGGGVSALWPMPSYQSGAPPTLNVINAASSRSTCGATTNFCRQVPDVAADADPATGYAIYFAGKWISAGGTSAAAPTWAALLALANASSTCAGSSVGFLNPPLYRLAGAAYPSGFNDVTAGSNDLLGVGGFSATPGYDMASGLGTPDAATLAVALCDRVSVAVVPGQSSVVGMATGLRLSAASTAGQSLVFTASGLPAGLTINPSTGVISGTPTAAGLLTVTVTARDRYGASASASFFWRVLPALVGFPSPGPRSGLVGRRTTLRLAARVNTGLPLSYSAQGLPPGLLLDRRTGIVAGVPVKAGRYSVATRATDPRATTGTAAFTWTIAGRPRISAASLRGLGAGAATLTLHVDAGMLAPGISSVSVRLPAGLQFAGGRRLRDGIRVRAHQHLTHSVVHGVLTLALAPPSGSVTLSLGGAALLTSTSLRHAAAARRVGTVTVGLTLTDVNANTIVLQARLRPA